MKWEGCWASEDGQRKYRVTKELLLLWKSWGLGYYKGPYGGSFDVFATICVVGPIHYIKKTLFNEPLPYGQATSN